MPIRAEVLQVEHTIEGAEDPRPNAYHSGEHGIHMSPPFMSGALNDGMPSMSAGDKDRAWDTKTGPPVSAKQVSPSLPININMYSYAARPDPWTKEGRERYANLGKGPGKSRSDIPPGTKDFWDGSLQNNMGPAMYNRDEARQGSTNGSNNSNDRSRAKHQDLCWGPTNMTASADRNGPGRTNWKQTDGNNDICNGSQNGSNRATWTANNDSTCAATSNGNGNGNGTDWNPNWDHDTNKHWATSSNNSKGSKTSNRSAAKPQADDWCDSSNNVGVSSGNSNKSGGSGGSKKSIGAPGDAADSGNAWGPTDDWSKGNTGGEDPSSKMPGAWDSTPNKEQNGGFPWGDTTAAQAVPDTQW
ncbi:hypothetical protein HYQ44_015231 [Verticillium longisporum]|nr:hypothetical protein HYQ44_015231 [Verticillium longisporum]